MLIFGIGFVIIIENYIHLYHKANIMAIAIKSIPILKDKAASSFNKKVESNSTRKATVDFSRQNTVASKILAKAKF